jgi:hypothetical protein
MRALISIDETIARSSPSVACAAANTRARSSSAPMSIVSSSGELNRLTDGLNPYEPIQSRYSDADMPSGMSAFTAL